MCRDLNRSGHIQIIFDIRAVAALGVRFEPDCVKWHPPEKPNEEAWHDVCFFIARKTSYVRCELIVKLCQFHEILGKVHVHHNLRHLIYDCRVATVVQVTGEHGVRCHAGLDKREHTLPIFEREHDAFVEKVVSRVRRHIELCCFVY